MSSNATLPEKNARAASGPCDPSQMPGPSPEHKWLEKFVGDWESEVEIQMGPDQPPMVAKATNRDRMLGGFWLLSEGENPGMNYGFLLTLGYDPKKGKYVGSWTDTMMPYLWRYEGTVNAAGTILTLETEGPAPMAPDKLAKFREVTEFKSPDHRVFTSSVLGADGKWSTMITVTARRKK